MIKVITHTHAGASENIYLQPISQAIKCSDSQTYANGLPVPISPDGKWKATVQAMDSSGVLLVKGGAKFELSD